MQVFHGWNPVFCILKLARDPQSGAAHELVVLLVDDTFRDVAVDDVESEKEGLRAEAVLLVDLNQEVDQVRPHVPSELWLHVDQLYGCHRLGLCEEAPKCERSTKETEGGLHGVSRSVT